MFWNNPVTWDEEFDKRESERVCLNVWGYPYDLGCQTLPPSLRWGTSLHLKGGAL